MLGTSAFSTRMEFSVTTGDVLVFPASGLRVTVR
jgi:hypothetical protein